MIPSDIWAKRSKYRVMRVDVSAEVRELGGEGAATQGAATPGVGAAATGAAGATDAGVAALGAATGAAGTGEVDARLDRLAALVGSEGVTKLRAASVCVFGLGGVGGSCALALARGGVGHLTVIDGDVVEQSNFNRQAIASAQTLGQPKSVACAQLIADINPAVAVEAVCARVTPEDVGSFIPVTCDYVIDCIDDMPVKIALAAWCAARGVPLISSMGTARKWHPERLRFADIYDTAVCPVCKVMRRELRRAGVECLQVLYSEEPPAPQVSGTAHPLGSTAFVPPVAGIMLAGHVVRHILGVQ